MSEDKLKGVEFQYVKPTEDQHKLMQKFRDKYQELADELAVHIPKGRGKALAKTKLEESAFWVNKAITFNDG